jgi:hypothetical protein
MEVSEDSSSLGAVASGLSSVEGSGLSSVEGSGLSSVEGSGLSSVEGSGLSSVEGSGRLCVVITGISGTCVAQCFGEDSCKHSETHLLLEET